MVALWSIGRLDEARMIAHDDIPLIRDQATELGL